MRSGLLRNQKRSNLSKKGSIFRGDGFFAVNEYDNLAGIEASIGLLPRHLRLYSLFGSASEPK